MDRLDRYAKDVLVTSEWLDEHRDDEGLRIVEVDEDPAAYAEAHIPGAIGFDWRRELQDQVRRDLLSRDGFAELVGARGISSEHTVVAYGEQGEEIFRTTVEEPVHVRPPEHQNSI